MSKAELMEAVWPDVTVEDNSLSQCISSLRRALGEAPGQNRYIVTEAGRGFRFSLSAGPRADAQDVKGRTTQNAQAYQFYVSGWYALTRPGSNTIERGIRQLERAVLLDPDFALAHVCIADGYALLGIFGVTPPRSVIANARTALQRALETSPDLSEAHAELGHLQVMFDLDYAAGAASYRRALQLDPRSHIAHHYMGLLQLAYGRLEDALAHLRHAQAEEPFAANVNANIGMVHYFASRYHEAIAQLQATLELDSEFSHARSFLGRAYLRLGEFDNALREFDRRQSGTILSKADIPMTLALAGRRSEAESKLANLLAEACTTYVSPYDIATVHASLGDKQAALARLEEAYAESAGPFIWLKTDPAFATVRSEPRFRALLSRLGVL